MLTDITLDIRQYLLDSYEYEDLPEEKIEYIAGYIANFFDYTDIFYQVDELASQALKEIGEEG